MLKTLITLLLAAMCCGACAPALTPYTRSVHSSLTVKEIKQLQFFTGEELLLRRELPRDEVRITPAHRLRRVQGQYIEEILVEKRTPGVARKVREDGLDVALDSRNPKQTMEFAQDDSHAEQFCLARTWHEGTGVRSEVEYEGKVFQVHSGACLTFIREDLQEIQRERRVLPGLRHSEDVVPLDDDEKADKTQGEGEGGDKKGAEDGGKAKPGPAPSTAPVGGMNKEKRQLHETLMDNAEKN